MTSLQNIRDLISENRLEEALQALDTHIAASPADDEALFLRGGLHWRLQQHAAAVTDYEAALAINPDSPARHALTVARDVFNYFNPDLLNP